MQRYCVTLQTFASTEHFFYLFLEMPSILWDCTFYLKILPIKLLQNTSLSLMTFFSHLLRRRTTCSEICAMKEEIRFTIAVPFVELGFPLVYTGVFIVSQLIMKCYTSYKMWKRLIKLCSAEGFIFSNFLDRIAFLFFHSIGIQKFQVHSLILSKH